MTRSFEDIHSSLAARIDRSKRYHQRRRGFLEGVHKFIMLLIIVAGSAAFSDVFGDLRSLALVAAVLAALDLVYAPSHKARDHEILFRRFSEADAELNGIKPNEADRIHAIEGKVLLIEADEPPTFCALERSCYNEVAQARGHRDLIRPLRWHQRLLMHVWPFEDLMDEDAPIRSRSTA